MEPLISIIIPIFNAEETIIPTIKNILNQTYSNYEILIIDDASTDKGAKKVNTYTKKYQNIKLISTNGEGFTHALNIGQKTAKGKYVIFFKTGNLMSQNFLEYIVELSQKYNSDITTCDYFEITELEFFNTNYKIPYMPKENINIFTSENYIRKLSSCKKHKFEKTYMLWNKLINKKILNNISFPSKKFCPDESLILDIINNSNKIVSSNQILLINTLINEYYIERCFTYTSIEKVEFLQKLLLMFKQQKDTNAIKNTCINFINTLCDIRKTLIFYYLDIYDLEVQKNIIDLKFNSIYKFLNNTMPSIANSQKYKKYFKRYKKIVYIDNFREKNCALYPQPQKYKGFYPELFIDSKVDIFLKKKKKKQKIPKPNPISRDMYHPRNNARRI